MSWITNIENAFNKDEQWVISEITKGWQGLQKAEQTIEIDILGIFQWVQTHQQSILAILKAALTEFTLVAGVVPQLSPAIPAATAAIDAATAAIDALSKGIQKGSTPLSTAVNAYHAVKDAQTAVNAVLKAGTTQPNAQ